MNERLPIPLRPDPAAIAARGHRSLARALVASARSCFRPGSAAQEIAKGDDGAKLILRAASAPHTTADVGLVQSIIEASVLGAVGAGADLLRRGVVVNFGGAASIRLPVLIADASHASFVLEGAPIPVHALNIGTPTILEPRKIKAIWSMSRETIEGSNAETLVEEAAKRSIGLALDQYLFDAVAGDDIRPAGLRYGVAALTASTDPDAIEAMLHDIKSLLTAVAPIGGDVILVAAPARAKMMAARSRGGTLPPVLGSPAVAAADLLAVAVDGLAVALDDTIDVASSKHAVMHGSTTPVDIGTPGSPATVAAPSRSLFQTDATALRVTLGVTWAVRHPSTVAWLSNIW